MTTKEYIELNGYEVSDLTREELSEVEAEVSLMDAGIVVSDGFFGPLSPFSQRMLEKRCGR